MSLARISLLAATILTGMSAGVMALFGHTIMRGLRKTDNRTFVGAFQAIDRAIINPLFMLTFFGALIFSGVATFVHQRGGVLPWTLTATGLYLAAVIITVAVHLPLNDKITAAGDLDRIPNLAAVRANFHEARWIAWNSVRTLASTTAFGCLTWALVLSGQTPS